jgi:hypothetical protein
MSLQVDLAKPSSRTGAKASFRDVVSYLHGISDAVHAMKRSASSGWPLAGEGQYALPAAAGDSPSPKEHRKAARLTLRHGEAEIELEGMLVHVQTANPFHAVPSRGGARLADLEGADDGRGDSAVPALRSTLPYCAPAVSLVPLHPFGGETERPADFEDQSAWLPYSALALSLVPIAPIAQSSWPEGGRDERVSAIRLRCAPLSAEFCALTGTDDWTDS